MKKIITAIALAASIVLPGLALAYNAGQKVKTSSSTTVTEDYATNDVVCKIDKGTEVLVKNPNIGNTGKVLIEVTSGEHAGRCEGYVDKINLEREENRFSTICWPYCRGPSAHYSPW